MRAPVLVLVLSAALIGWTAPAIGQQEGAAPAERAVEAPTSPVVLDGVTLFQVRGVSVYPAAQRAAAIADRIEALAADRRVPVDSLLVREEPLGSVLAAGDRQLLAVVEQDAQVEGVGRQLLAEVYRKRIVDAIERFRHDREAPLLWRNAAKTAAATLAFALVLWLGLKLLSRTRKTLDQRYRARVLALQFQTMEIVRVEHLWQGLHRAFTALGLLIGLLVSYVYLHYVLLLFPWTRGLGSSLSQMVLGPLATLGLGAVGYLPDLVFLIILALLTRALLRVVHVFFGRLGDGTLKMGNFDPDWAVPSDRIAKILIIAFALVLAYPHLPGSGSEAFKGISLMIGLIFSLGSSSVIGNVIAGQSLAYRRAFKVGDRVKIGEHVGEVSQVRLLTTYLRSPKNEQIVIPNSTILNTEVVNFSTLAHDKGLILHTIVGIGYETSWRQVQAMLLQAAARTPGLLRQPAPFVLQRALGTFAVDYELNVYCDSPHTMLLLYSALHSHIQDVFNEYGVQIMTPAYEGDPEQPKVVSPDHWYVEPAIADAAAISERIPAATAPA
ncbi:MAG TPA: mechanosensitive ion channel domain-containing protein [Gemmatimonadales bacterium]